MIVVSYHGEMTLCGWFDWPTMHYYQARFPTIALRYATKEMAAPWPSPPDDMAPQQIVRSSRTNDLIRRYDGGEAAGSGASGVTGKPYSDKPLTWPEGRKPFDDGATADPF